MSEGLTLRQVRFANRVAEREVTSSEGDWESNTKLAIAAGYSQVCAAQMASENLKNPYVLEAIEDRKRQLATAAGLSPEWILREYMAIASADPNQLVRVVTRCCDDCWALSEVELPPNADCKRCKGAGLSFVCVSDTSKLTGSARKLYAGAKQTKDGIEIKMRDQDGALRFLAEYIGMGKRMELSGPGGGPIPIAATGSRPEDLSDEQLAALIIAELGVSKGVQPQVLLPSNTIDATLEPV